MNFVENIPCIPRYHVTDTGEITHQLVIKIFTMVKEVQILTMVSIQLD